MIVRNVHASVVGGNTTTWRVGRTAFGAVSTTVSLVHAEHLCRRQFTVLYSMTDAAAIEATLSRPTWRTMLEVIRVARVVVIRTLVERSEGVHWYWSCCRNRNRRNVLRRSYTQPRCRNQLPSSTLVLIVCEQRRLEKTCVKRLRHALDELRLQQLSTNVRVINVVRVRLVERSLETIRVDVN